MKDLVLKHAIINAVEHNGKADVGAVLGKIIAEDPAAKTRIKEIIGDVKKIVSEVNSLGVEEQKRKFDEMKIVVHEKKKEEGLPDLPDAQVGKVIMRIAPFPSGPLHIGNARMVILNDEYVKRYKGKLFLIIDDTIGSEEKFILPEAYDLITDGLKWLGVKWNKLIFKSDRLEIFYKYAELILKRGLAYVCECDAETLRKNRASGTACEHRVQDSETNLKKWKMMLKGKYKTGEAIVRLKTYMQNPDPAFRDRVLLRIEDKKHPRVGKKYRVWPMLEFSWAIDDYLLGTTHILRGKQLVIEDMMEDFIWEKLGWPKKVFVHYGMIRIKDAEGKLSKTETRKLVKEKVYTGWDDPRTWSLQSLERRGIQPQAIRNFIINLGLSESDIEIPADILYSENRKLIDAKANRYFAVLNPVNISVESAKKTKYASSPLHPDFPKRGNKKIPVDMEKIFVEKSDFDKLSGQDVGLMNLFSINLSAKSKMISEKIKYEIPKIHWVSKGAVKIKVVMHDGSVSNGLAEPAIKKLKKGEMIQLVRIGFCKVDKAGKETVLYFSHK